MDFAQLTTDTADLLAQAGLRCLSLTHDYCATYGHFYYASARRGTVGLTLVGHEGEGPARTIEQLNQRLTDALLEQLSAALEADANYYVSAGRL